MRASTLKDVARAADVSVASASRVINGIDTVTEEVRARVLEAARRLRYLPNWGARSLVMCRTNTIGLLLPDIYGEFFSEIIRGADSAARARNLQLLVSGSYGDRTDAVAAMQSMSGRVDGLLVMSPICDVSDLAETIALNVPLVTIGDRSDARNQGAIRIGNFDGACKAVRHLAAAGCERIAHICGPKENIDAQERLRGFSETVAALFPGSEPRVCQGDFAEGSGYTAMRTLLDGGNPPDGVFVGNDMMAAGVLHAAKEAGLDIPGELAVIGFDDIPLARFMSPPLSTLRVGVYEIGCRALELLIAAIEGDNGSKQTSFLISPELVVRESSKRVVVRPHQERGHRQTTGRSASTN